MNKFIIGALVIALSSLSAQAIVPAANYRCHSKTEGAQVLNIQVFGKNVYDLNRKIGNGTVNLQYKPMAPKMNAYYEYKGFKNGTRIYLEKNLINGDMALNGRNQGWLVLRTISNSSYKDIQYFCNSVN